MMIDAPVLLYDLKSDLQVHSPITRRKCLRANVKSPKVAEIKQPLTSRVRKDSTARKLFPKSSRSFMILAITFFTIFEVTVLRSEYYVQKKTETRLISGYMFCVLFC